MPENKIATTGESPVQLESIQERILTIRGQQVMLDRDLAALYGVETKQLKRQVNRNRERFPEDFMFQLSKEELDHLRCQFGTSSWGGVRYAPYAFTENGVAMLSSVLGSAEAIQVNIAIMRAFNAMRHFLSANEPLFRRIETIEVNQLAIVNQLAASDRRQDEHERQLADVLRRLDEGKVQPPQGIFFDGQVFDAYEFVSGLVRQAKERIVLIDNYVDESVLTLLSKRSDTVTATIYTGKITKQLRLDLSKHNAQYAPIEVRHFRQSHDRFLCIDSKVYLIGASLKDLGKKWFGFSRLHDITTEDLMSRIIAK